MQKWLLKIMQSNTDESIPLIGDGYVLLATSNQCNSEDVAAYRVQSSTEESITKLAIVLNLQQP